MAIHSSNRYRRGYSTHSANDSSFRRGRSHNLSGTTSSNKRDKDDFRRLCLEYRLCFKCCKPEHQSSTCPNASCH